MAQAIPAIATLPLSEWRDSTEVLSLVGHWRDQETSSEIGHFETPPATTTIPLR